VSKFYLSEKAQLDIESIYAYTIEKWSQKQADRYFDLLQLEMQFAADSPYLSKSIMG